MADDRSAKRIFDKEQAEGERETVDDALEDDATGKPARAEIPADERQGVTNKPLAEERRQQRKVPPRGEASGEAKNE